MSLRGERRSWETEQRKARKLKIPEQPEVLEGDDDDEEEEDELPKKKKTKTKKRPWMKPTMMMTMLREKLERVVIMKTKWSTWN